MTVSLLFIVTVALEAVFVYLGLWLIARWLNAADTDQTVRAAVEELEASGCSEPKPGCCKAYDDLARLAA
ncbi:MAG: hypothetical protein D6760_12105 [Deltaproteobacteria bacterium]|nr:MAG: hypothetical protein D6760_12105 [Deltaproteobacteria bacterium]